jgi:hypothetical protein
MRYLVAALFLLFAATVAFSQQPPPAKGKSGQPQQPSTTDQRGTQQTPFVVKVLPIPKTNEEEAQEAKERNEKEALADAGIQPLRGPFLDFLDPWGNRIEIVGYDNVQFTKAPNVLRGMGLTDLSKNEQALKELTAKGMEPS